MSQDTLDLLGIGHGEGGCRDRRDTGPVGLAGMGEAIQAALATNGPSLCEVILDKAQPFAPKLSSRRLEDGSMVTSALEDLAPFLSREELADNMLIPLAGG